jgi:hypothetical protein
MKFFRALALVVAAALLAPFAGRVFAQGVQIAGGPPPAQGAPKTESPKAESPKAEAPKKSGAKPKKKSAKKKKKPAPESKYTSRAMSENGAVHYRFDEDGNPISTGKKKPAAKSKKKSSEDSEDKPACTEDAPCSDKKSSDADSL